MKLLGKHDWVEITAIIFLFLCGLAMMAALIIFTLQLRHSMPTGCTPYAAI